MTVTEGDEPYMDIVVSKVSAKKSYGSGYFIDRPAKGNVRSLTNAAHWHILTSQWM